MRDRYFLEFFAFHSVSHFFIESYSIFAGMRSGTLNVPGIVGFGQACEICTNEMSKDSEGISRLRDKLEIALLVLEGTRVNGNKQYRLPHANDVSGKFTVFENGKRYFTAIFVVVVLLATTDIVFALDSIPAVFAISQDRLVIYTSNIFAVLGLRSLFFLLQGAVDQFEYLQQGIAIVLIFIGLKMLAEAVHVYVPVWASLMVIVVCLFGSILYSVQNTEKEKE